MAGTGDHPSVLTRAAPRPDTSPVHAGTVALRHHHERHHERHHGRGTWCPRPTPRRPRCCPRERPHAIGRPSRSTDAHGSHDRRGPCPGPCPTSCPRDDFATRCALLTQCPCRASCPARTGEPKERTSNSTNKKQERKQDQEDKNKIKNEQQESRSKSQAINQTQWDRDPSGDVSRLRGTVRTALRAVPGLAELTWRAAPGDSRRPALGCRV